MQRLERQYHRNVRKTLAARIHAKQKNTAKLRITPTTAVVNYE